ISPAACRSGSYRANRGAIRSTTSPNAALHRSGSTLCAAATAAASVFHTSSECLPGGRPSRLRHAPTVSHQHQRSRSTAVVLALIVLAVVVVVSVAPIAGTLAAAALLASRKRIRGAVAAATALTLGSAA